MLTLNNLFRTSRYLRWVTQFILLGLSVVVHTACSANPIQQGIEPVNPTRLTIRFQDDHGEPPKEIPIKMPDGQVITISRERPLSGGMFRYRVPATSREQLQDIVRQLDGHPDIDYVELDQRRRID